MWHSGLILDAIIPWIVGYNLSYTSSGLCLWMDPIDRQCILKAMALSPLPPLLVLRRAHPVSCDGVCVPAVSGITSAVYSVGRSVLAAALLHAFCFSAVKVSM